MDFERAESRREDFYVRTYVSSKRRSLEGCNFFQREFINRFQWKTFLLLDYYPIIFRFCIGKSWKKIREILNYKNIPEFILVLRIKGRCVNQFTFS